MAERWTDAASATATATDSVPASDEERLDGAAADVWPADTGAADAYLLESFYMRDRDYSGSLNAAEFVGGVSEELRQRQATLFVAADRNGDGLLTALEYREKLLGLTGAAHASKTETSERFKSADAARVAAPVCRALP